MKDIPLTPDTYIPDTIYDRLVDTLARLIEAPFEPAGTDAKTEVIAALGEIGGVWPEGALN
ncbi:hypothetical protein ATO6_12320 [Oceanicola sp. 22II-s10i]|uniref:hypothetical protein n=1 Tax=Oceanicola sp. 22II-s10i TaxID=1317116 RepID=UPI000B52933C|nr:hypothetical protein [Oceanicola sp. 22II-s10i]OWU84471.1 hypothetical protein ATO6_12320 [Oceanicola sp. 22II-s10i]